MKINERPGYESVASCGECIMAAIKEFAETGTVIIPQERIEDLADLIEARLVEFEY
jgi:hypothetical protein